MGASGYVVNLVVYAFLLEVELGLHYLPAAVGSFLVAVANNYTWNRHWTFRVERGHVGSQGLRFLVVSTAARCVAQPRRAARARHGRRRRDLLAQAIAIILVTPLNFVGNKLWSFRR